MSKQISASIGATEGMVRLISIKENRTFSEMVKILLDEAVKARSKKVKK